MNDPASESQANPAAVAAGVVRGYDELRRAAIALVQQARRDIRLFGSRLNPLVFNTASITDALVAFAVGHPRNRVRVLVEDAEQVLRDNGRLVTAARRLGNLEIRAVEESDRGARDVYLLSDRSACLVIQAAEENEAVVATAPPQPGVLAQRFEAAWERAEPMAMRTLGL